MSLLHIKIRGWVRWLIRGALPALVILAQSFTVKAASEETFDLLQIGTHEYRNVTVTTKSKDYVFILHSAGMTNIKVAELPEDVRAKLGYASSEKSTVHTNAASVWAKQTFAKLETPQVKGVEQQLISKWQSQAAGLQQSIPPLNRSQVAGAIAALVVVYLFWCFSAMRLCQKTGQNPGLLVWLPVFQMLPLLRAANMSRWWFLVWLMPILNLIPCILWCFNIASVRGKNFLVALGLLLPVTSPLAFLYLAFSDGPAPQKKEERRVEIMTLEAA